MAGQSQRETSDRLNDALAGFSFCVAAYHAGVLPHGQQHTGSAQKPEHNFPSNWRLSRDSIGPMETVLF